jgi:hypothetical protein
MKKTKRDNWQVVAVVRPQKTHMSIASLGFKDTWGDPLEGLVWGQQFELTILPKRLGDIGGGISMSDSLISRDIEGDYQKRCEFIRDGMLRHPNVIEARIECDEEHYCSHCSTSWEVLATSDDVAEFGQDDGLSIVGEPACCEAAINEFRAEHGIPSCST